MQKRQAQLQHDGDEYCKLAKEHIYRWFSKWNSTYTFIWKKNGHDIRKAFKAVSHLALTENAWQVAHEAAKLATKEERH